MPCQGVVPKFLCSVRDEICSGKETGEEWLNAHRAVHKAGIFSNATMLFGHIETPEQRIEHLNLLRQLQDETHGFYAFIPLVFHPEHNSLGRRILKSPRKKISLEPSLFLDYF